MIVESSAIIAIATDEPGSQWHLQALLASPSRRVSAATLLEAAIVVDRHPNPLAATEFDRLIERIRFVVEPFTASQAAIARDAYQRFCKGSGHPAQLNFGDCFTYALARDLDEPVLFIGQDFVHTDVRSAIPISVQPWTTESAGMSIHSVAQETAGPMTLEMDPYEAERVEQSTPEMLRWYFALRAFMLELGRNDNVNVYARGVKSGHVGFWRSRRTGPDHIFAYANFRPTQNRIVIDIAYPTTPLHLDGEFLMPWMGEQKRDKVVRIVIDSDQDVDRAKPLIRQRYDSLG